MSTSQDPRKTWLATGRLLTVWWRMPISEAKIAPCLPALAVAHLPLCLWLRGEDCMQLASSSLVFAQSFLLWAGQAPHCIRVFCRKVLSLFYFFSLSIPDFLLLSHISSLRLSSGHSGPVLTLSMQPATPCSACTRWLWIWVSGLLLCWELWLGAYSVGFFVFFVYPPGYVGLWDSKTPHRPTGESVSCCLETSPPSRLPPQDGSPSLTLLYLFLSFIFVLPPFEENGLTFRVPGVLCQHSDVVLWKLLSIQMIFL